MRKRLILLLVIFITLLHLVPTSNIEKETKREWTIEDSKNYAKDSLVAWQQHQWECLDKLCK